MLAVAGLGEDSCDRFVQHNDICDVASAPHNATAGMSAMRCGQHRHNFRAINHVWNASVLLGSRRREKTA